MPWISFPTPFGTAYQWIGGGSPTTPNPGSLIPPVTTPTAPPAPPPFVPTYITPTPTITDGTNVWPLNQIYFADDATALAICGMVGGLMVVQQPFPGNGGMFSVRTEMNVVLFPGGKTIIAGILADCWTRNPNNPNVALQEAMTDVASLG